ncbi:uncharacterized protein LOC122401889 [Colletes gigas]|uniref:uncharacterized protein LOC122401889 n=1 Tax=Colletes gigas TaxID=935657 RepID=UPI001C9A8674|nr:uncharacterized protein LOC122401889 [Colletes gigas]
MRSEDEAWAQTVITVTPEEDATLREILDTAILSAPADIPLDLDEKIVYRRSFTHRQFLDSNESEQEAIDWEVEITEEEDGPRSQQDAENQTYLQGTPIVRISVEYRDEGSQTMYMSPPCPPLTYYKDIMTSMNQVPMPTIKSSNAATTIITFHPKTLQLYTVTAQLTTNIAEEELEEFVATVTSEEEAEMEVTEILYFLIARAFWIIEPTSQREIETEDKETETLIKFDYHRNTLVIDSETQTELTCEPKKSNTTLLSEYCETKNIMLSYLEDCISKGIDSRIAIDDIIDEIINKCTDRIRYPMLDQTTQTIVTYKLRGEKEEDVLRKLKLEVVVDPFEATIVVVPLMDNLLQIVSDTVSRNAPKIVNNILGKILRRTMTIVNKLIQLEQELQPTEISEILEQRRKKILESMLKTETEANSTQTSIAAVSEVQKIKDDKEDVIVCSVCRRPSECRWCLGDYENETVPRPEINILRTQDILLAYKPCYIMTTVSDKETSLQSSYRPVNKLPAPQTPYVPISKQSSEKSDGTINIFLQPKIVSQKSINEWSYVVDTTLMKPCSMKDSSSSTNQTITSSEKLISKSCEGSCYLRGALSSQAANALRILKDTFCSQENCFASSSQSLNKSNLSKEFEDICDKSTCNACSSKSSSIDKTFKQSLHVSV